MTIYSLFNVATTYTIYILQYLVVVYRIDVVALKTYKKETHWKIVQQKNV